MPASQPSSHHTFHDCHDQQFHYEIPNSSPASQRRLRRSPGFFDQRRASPALDRVAVTLGPRGQYVLADAEPKERAQPQTQPQPQPRRLTRKLSQENLSDDSLAASTSPPSAHRWTTSSSFDPDRPEPHPAVRISKHTHSAILYALEETLRGPKQISDDPVELYAQMSDLMGGRGMAPSNGNANSPGRPSTSRGAHGSPSGIRGPRIIMQERAAREARQREERERAEREHAEVEERLHEEALRREEERLAAAAAMAGPSAAASMAAGAGRSTHPTSGRVPGGEGAPGPSRMPTSAQAQPSQAQRHGRTTSGPAQGVPDPNPSGPTTAGPSGTQPQSGDTSTAIGRGRNSFPHAFERWETLSAHWEGLTSFWIRRLEQNAQEIGQDAISQQLSRQVTDLSSAGANLFHAVVELQRLRASSERKFQRWFFETRAELERNQEVTAMLEAALEEERRSRADAIREALEHEKGSSKIQKQLAEMRKELTISKEEARRAWEELGRREQEERDRTTSLQLGQPTVVGGVQVVPMTQGVGRGDSQRDPRYGQQEPSERTQSTTSRPEYGQAPPVQAVPTSASGNPAYQTPTAVQHQGSYGSEGTYSEEEFETPGTQPGVYQPTGSGGQEPQYPSEPDYSGSGYSAPGWEEMQPRHHHPTRLSDVLEEEEERSRTSASQSQVSRP